MVKISIILLFSIRRSARNNLFLDVPGKPRSSFDDSAGTLLMIQKPHPCIEIGIKKSAETSTSFHLSSMNWVWTLSASTQQSGFSTYNGPNLVMSNREWSCLLWRFGSLAFTAEWPLRDQTVTWLHRSAREKTRPPSLLCYVCNREWLPGHRADSARTVWRERPMLSQKSTHSHMHIWTGPFTSTVQFFDHTAYKMSLKINQQCALTVCGVNSSHLQVFKLQRSLFGVAQYTSATVASRCKSFKTPSKNTCFALE